MIIINKYIPHFVIMLSNEIDITKVEYLNKIDFDKEENENNENEKDPHHKYVINID